MEKKNPSNILICTHLFKFYLGKKVYEILHTCIYRILRKCKYICVFQVYIITWCMHIIYKLIQLYWTELSLATLDKLNTGELAKDELGKPM